MSSWGGGRHAAGAGDGGAGVAEMTRQRTAVAGAGDGGAAVVGTSSAEDSGGGGHRGSMGQRAAQRRKMKS